MADRSQSGMRWPKPVGKCGVRPGEKYVPVLVPSVMDIGPQRSSVKHNREAKIANWPVSNAAVCNYSRSSPDFQIHTKLSKL
jgi:hypothetical protein